MFPHTFVHDHVNTHTSPDDIVLDPFSGRGTTLLESLLLGRQALALDINPVAACITGAKARVPDLHAVERRVDGLEGEFCRNDLRVIEEERHSLPAFFSKAFHYLTLREILFLKRELRWEQDDLDRFIAALVLGALHGDHSPAYLSNQMPRTISTKPDYSIRYWKSHRLRPARKRTFAILKDKARFRLADGPTVLRRGISMKGDVRSGSALMQSYRGCVRLLITSPPYLDVTNFEEDQWLRLWFLGGEPRPTYGAISKDDRYTNEKRYWRFLADAWRGVGPLLAGNAVIVCRIGGRLSLDSLAIGLCSTIRSALPDIQLISGPHVSSPAKRQTDNFRPGVRGCGFEADFVFRRVD